MEQALLWSIHVNLAVKEPGMEQGVFYGVREALEKMSPKADLAVVSSANAQAVEEEWSKYELKPYCKALLSQEAVSYTHLNRHRKSEKPDSRY